jgi:pimeloyl-ACP methyl ester carboxylesterase
MPADLYVPAGTPRTRSRPGVVLSLGANDLGLRDPRVIGLANALARSGFVTLVLAGSDSLAQTVDLDGPIGLVEAADSVVAGFEWLLTRPEVDPRRTGMLGVCVGGSICLMAASRPAIAQQAAFLFVIGPYLSLRRLLVAVASRSSLTIDGQVRAWPVEAFALERQRAWLLGMLSPSERARVRAALAVEASPELSSRSQAVLQLARGVDSWARADELVNELGPDFDDLVEAGSPDKCLGGLRAETFIMHGVADGHIPVDESRRLASALRGQVPLHYAEFELFEHTEPSRALASMTLARELARLLGHVSSFMRFACP